MYAYRAREQNILVLFEREILRNRFEKTTKRLLVVEFLMTVLTVMG
jgi:hypothetical protein